MPEFHAREGLKEDWKQAVLRGEIQLEEIDTTPYKDRFGKTLANVGPKAAAAE